MSGMTVQWSASDIILREGKNNGSLIWHDVLQTANSNYQTWQACCTVPYLPIINSLALLYGSLHVNANVICLDKGTINYKIIKTCIENV